MNGSSVARASTSVTRVPMAANIEAYSTPMTPAPTTVIVRGTASSRRRMPSESMTRPSSKSTPFGRAGRVPTASTMLSAVTIWSGVVGTRGGDGGPAPGALGRS